MNTVSLAGCIITDQQKRVLLLRRRNEVWEIPGGKKEDNETSVEAARRELKEELGLTMGSLILLGETSFSGEGNIWYLYKWYGGEVAEGEPTILEPEKHDALDYFDMDRLLPNMRFSTNVRDFSEAVQKGTIVL